MTRHRVAADDGPELEQIGDVGDVNFPEYDGGPIYCRKPKSGEQKDIYGDCFVEYVEIPPDDLEFDDPDARWTIYRVDLDPEVPSWGDIKDVARTTDQDPDELAAAFVSNDPLERAYAYETWAGHYGWHEFDQYPLVLTRLETEERYDADLGGKSGIVSALEETVERMADDSGAQAWSTLGDALLSDIAADGYDPDSAVCIARFGDAVAVNGDVLVDRGWEQALGIKPGKHPKLWNEVGVRQLEGWLEKNGYELTDFGGRVPTTEEEVSGEHVVHAVAKQLELPEETVMEIAQTLDWWQKEIPWGTSGDTSTWAKRRGAARTEESRRSRVREPQSVVDQLLARGARAHAMLPDAVAHARGNRAQFWFFAMSSRRDDARVVDASIGKDAMARVARQIGGVVKGGYVIDGVAYVMPTKH